MRCTSCDKQKNELKKRKSRLFKSMDLFLCTDCEAKKMEPRFLVILFGRAEGPDAVAEYIKNHRYVGDEISAKELLS